MADCTIKDVPAAPYRIETPESSPHPMVGSDGLLDCPTMVSINTKGVEILFEMIRGYCDDHSIDYRIFPDFKAFVDQVRTAYPDRAEFFDVLTECHAQML